MARRPGKRWSPKRRHPVPWRELLADIEHWIDESDGDTEVLDAALEASAKAIRQKIADEPVTGNLDEPIKDLLYIRDGQSDELGDFLMAIVRALRELKRRQ